MYENKPLQLAFLISILLHFAVFLSAPYTGVLPKKEAVRPIKVAYIKEEEIPKKLTGQRPGRPGVSRQIPIMTPEALPEVRKEDIANPLPAFNPQPQTAAKPGQVKKEKPTI